MDYKNLSDDELMDAIENACRLDDQKTKKELIRNSSEESRIPALIFEMLYELIDYDLNFIIEILKNASHREKQALFDDAKDVEGFRELLEEYDDPKDVTIEYIVEGRNEDALWMINTGAPKDDLSRAFLQRCLLAIAYYIGFKDEISYFFETEKRKLIS